MILQELFESNMKRVLDALREIKTLSDDEFYSVHDMSKAQWVRAYWPVIKSVAANDAEITKHMPKPDAHLFHEGSQKFGKLEPYWVCINGKKWKRFDTYAHARAVHDKLEKKLRSEGSDKKVSLLADDDVTEGLRDPKDNPCWKGYKPVGTKQKGGRTVPNCVPKE